VSQFEEEEDTEVIMLLLAMILLFTVHKNLQKNKEKKGIIIIWIERFSQLLFIHLYIYSFQFVNLIYTKNKNILYSQLLYRSK